MGSLLVSIADHLFAILSTRGQHHIRRVPLGSASLRCSVRHRGGCYSRSPSAFLKQVNHCLGDMMASGR